MTFSKNPDRLVLGNWKMNGNLHENSLFLRELSSASFSSDYEVGICLPFPYLFQAVNMLADSRITWGGQDISAFDPIFGPYTGEVSSSMLKDFSCRWVILGHSERRLMCNESETFISKKIDIALSAGLTPVICVGESMNERRAGLTMQVIEHQLQPIRSLKLKFPSLVLAYEPVWAIGGAVTAAPETVQKIHSAIREIIDIPGVRILYGGSVTANNAKDLFKMPDINGALVGRASLCVKEFLKIINS